MCDRSHTSLGSYPDIVLTAPVPFARFSIICCTRFVARSLALFPDVSARLDPTTSIRPVAVR